MQKLSLFDHRFLDAVGIRVTQRSTDASFLRECGISPLVEPRIELTDTCNAPSAGDCGEPSYTTPEGIPLDGTVQTLQSLGLPITPENWLRLQTMGRFSSVDELDGEVLAELPEWVRGTFKEDLGLTEQ